MAADVNWDAVRQDAAQTLSRYVQFDTTNPSGHEMPAAEWLRHQLIGRGITDDVVIREPAPGRGLVVARIAGDASLKPLLVNHHIDVVAADLSQWTHPPFSGAIADGFVWGRGTLDTKNLGVVLMLALELLLQEGINFRRPGVFLAVPDEETGGGLGMGWLLERYLEGLDPEWVWDEGGGGERQSFPASFVLRHLSNPLVLRLFGRRLTADKLLDAILRDTVSLTVLRAGYKVNVIPEQAEAELDYRLLPDTDVDEFHRWLRQRIDDEQIEVEVEESSPPSGVAPLDSPFYRAASRAVERHVPGGTDGRYFRQRGYPACGFGPMVLEAEDIGRMHGIDERISLDNLVLGVKRLAQDHHHRRPHRRRALSGGHRRLSRPAGRHHPGPAPLPSGAPGPPAHGVDVGAARSR